MNDLIKITYENDNPAVSARELHEFLEINTPYHKWFPRMCEYGFIENQDYLVTDIFVHHSKGGSQSYKDAILTIDMAKELCMIQRTERGKQARQYFIQVEKAWNEPTLVMARALKIAKTQIDELATQNSRLVSENEEAKKKIENFEPTKKYVDEILQSDECLTITQIAADYGLSGIALNRILKEEGIQRMVNGQWILYKPYIDKNYVKSITYPYRRSNGKQSTTLVTYWTQAGRKFIYQILKERGVKPIVG